MRFQTPQFIDIEDKIFGPFTFKQFIYLIGGVSLSYVFFKVAPLWIAVILIIPTLALAGMLTFYKINNKPFIYTLGASIKYMFQTKLYLWKDTKKKVVGKKVESVGDIKSGKALPRLTESRLADISWSLDVLDMDQNNK
jgi:hypothetical protein